MKNKFKKVLLSLFIICMVITLVSGFVPGFVKNVYASGAYYVDGTNGNDSYNGLAAAYDGANGPFKTIQKAASVAVAGDTVYIEAGTYRETVTPANSGSAGSVIKFQNYNGGSVTVDGCDPVTGWTQDTGNIYKASMNWNLNEKNQIFVNGEMMNGARWPNQTGTLLQPTLTYADSSTYHDDNGMYIIDANLPGNIDFTGATLHAIPGHEWIWLTTTVNGYSSSQHELACSMFPNKVYYYSITDGNGFYLDGLKPLLDTEKEWFYDSSTSQLYLWMPGGGSPTNVEAKRRDTAFDLSNCSYIQIVGINTFASTVKTNDSTNHCMLKNMTCKYLSHSNINTYGTESSIHSLDQTGLGILLKGSYNEINSCELAYSSGGLVSVQGSYNNVINCYIHDGGYQTDWDGLVALDGTCSLISNNTICNAVRSCITWENMRKNQIQYNDVYNALLTTKDGGIMYNGYDDAENSAIHHNWVHDNKSTGIGGGIYLDNACCNFIIYDNVIWNTSASGDAAIRINTPTNYNIIYNNTGWNGIYSNSVDGNGTGNRFRYDYSGTRVFNNIIRGLSSDVYNYCTNGNSIFDNPAFVDSNNNDYRIQSSSSAIDKGVVESGITDGYNGVAPDCGAYEYNSSNWTPGYNFSNPPSPTYSEPCVQYMNLVSDNSGFERGDLTSWTKIGAMNATVASDSCDRSGAELGGKNTSGFYGLQLGGNSSADGVERTITGLSPNTVYTLQGWTSSDGNSEVDAIGVKDYGGPDKSVTSQSQTWHNKSLSFITGSNNTSATIYLKKISSGSRYIYFDNIGVQYAGVNSNLAYGKATSCSSFYTDYYETDVAANATDGSEETRWNANGGCPGWWEVDLGMIHTINTTELDLYDPENRYYQYKIDISTDGSNYTTVVDKTSNTVSGTTLTDTFTAVSARYVRITFTGCSASGGYPGIYECRIFHTPPTHPNLAYGKTTSCSSYYSDDYAAANATDGSKETRWNANGGCPEWWEADLGTAHTINTIKLDLYDPENRYYQYKIDVSTDGSNYTTVVDKTSNTVSGPTLTDTFIAVSARYVKISFTGCSIAGGYPGIYECRIFNTLEAIPPDSYTVSVSASPAEGGTVSGGGMYEEGAPVEVTAIPNSGYTFIRWTDNENFSTTDASYAFAMGTKDIHLIAEFEGTSTPVTNLAYGKTTSCSSYYTDYYETDVAADAIDGSEATRWNANEGCPGWWEVDLGSMHTINTVELDLYDPEHRYYQYKVDISTDGSNYTTIVDKTSNTVSAPTLIDTFTPVSARYVRISFTGCSASGGYPGIYECRVFNTIPNLAYGKTTSCSSYYTDYYETDVAADATDGSEATRWNANEGCPGWWEVDLGSMHTINTVELALYDPENRYYQYKVDISTDGSNYTTVVDRTSNTVSAPTLIDTFTPVGARYVRISFTGCSASGGYPGIYECRVFNR